MKVVYFMAKTIQIKSYTTCSMHQLRIDVDKSEALHSIIMIKALNGKLTVLRRFFQPSYTQLAVLYM